MSNLDDKTHGRKRTFIGIGLTSICLIICLIDWFQVSGSEYGIFYGVFADPQDFSGFAVGGPNYYQSINIWYFTIIICLIIYMVGVLLGRSLPAVIARGLALCIATFPFFNMLMYKLAVSDSSTRKDWLEPSIYLDFVCLILIATIIGTEIITYLSRKTVDFRLMRDI